MKMRRGVAATALAGALVIGTLAVHLLSGQQPAFKRTVLQTQDLSAPGREAVMAIAEFVKANCAVDGHYFNVIRGNAKEAALKEIPAVNAEIDGDDLIYKNHYDIGVAVGTEQGLVVPVVRDADQLGFADIEKKIADLGRRARDGKLAIEEMAGGTFTITNGGIFGSLMSTPILNPPQSGILGMHKIQPRPMAVGDKIEVRPMMYLALSYDHRIVDGREAVTFLVRVKECIEDPQRLILEM